MGDIFSKAMGYFMPGDSSDPRVNPQLRQRIALAMMARDRKFPKNVGEGLSAIGDAIGERRLMKSLEEGDLAQQNAASAITAGVTGAAPTGAAPTPYAPPDSVPPAVAAINRAASAEPVVETPEQPPPPLETAPSQPASMLAPTMPSGIQGVTGMPIGQAVDPRPMLPPAARVPGPPQASPLDGGYNILDAQAGMKRQGQGRVQDAVTRAYPDNPDMQAYASQLAAGEQQRPGETSSTGARGPWQFVPGTARQYGLSNPDDVNASADALKRFTANNAAIFERSNGRPPTMAELAVMHQQGGQTGANMIAGTGNASPRNLSLNNVNPNAGPAQAVNAIKGYYGMPDRPVDARGAIAAQIMARGADPETASAVPQPNPTAPGPAPPGGDDQRLAFNGQPSAAPAPSGIRAAPPVQQVQAQPPQARFDYVMPEQKPLQPPDPTPIGKTEAWAQAQKNANPNNPYVTRDMDQIIAQEQAKRAFRDKTLTEQFTANQTQARELEMKRQEQIATQAKRGAEGAKQASDAEIYRRTGQSPEQFYPEMDKQKASVDQTVRAQDAQQLARKAIRDGVITGYGANMRVAKDKFADWAFNNGLKGNEAANTEIMSAALKSGLSEAVKTVNGEGGTGVSNTDVRIAEGIAGSDPNLQMKTIQSIMDRAAAINNNKINRYEEKVSTYLAGHPQELNYATNARPAAPPDKLKLLLDSQADSAKADAMRGHFNEVYGPGAAELEIARFKRAQQRKGG